MKPRVVMLLLGDPTIDARVQKEARSVALAGYEVHLLCFPKHGLKRELEETPYTVHLVDGAVSEPLYAGNNLRPRLGEEDVWKPLRVLVNRTITDKRLREYRAKYGFGMDFSAYIRLPELNAKLRELKPEIIHCHDLYTLYLGYMAKQEFGCKLIYDSHEIFLELHTLDELLKPGYSEVEAQVFPELDGFITVSPQIAEILTTKYGSDIEPVVLYNGGAQIMSEVQPLSNPPRLFFQGIFALDRNNLELIEAMESLRGKATLTFQGWGPDEENYRKLIAELGLEDTVQIIDPAPPLEVVSHASNFDIGVINSKCIDDNFKNTLPNKLFDYMAAGLAIASTDLPAIQAIVEKEDCGITYAQKGARHTAEVLLELVSDPVRIARYKENALKAATTYSWGAQEVKLVELYDRLSADIISKKE